MAVNFDTPAASKGCTPAQFEAIKREFDVFARSDVPCEVIVDTAGWDAEEEPMQALTRILEEPADELINLYLICYVED